MLYSFLLIDSCFLISLLYMAVSAKMMNHHSVDYLGDAERLSISAIAVLLTIVPSVLLDFFLCYKQVT